ncbi:alpha/beta fold hydrolase [Nocardia thailandica]|uniref:alpha/beta fold hydrolase n=1 Tax=Nocardia thailandica TaxID=257275 RepID=UPI0002D2895F|nr:alpha/beta hydrolase [Nocardia thailandica]
MTHTPAAPTTSRPGVDLAFDEAGTGSVALYAHGAFLSRAEDDRLGHVILREALPPGLRLVRYDARGHGLSGGRAVADDYLYERLGEDLLAVADRVQPESPIVGMGASMGAASLLQAAVRRPDRFTRLVLIIPPTAWEARSAQAESYLAQADLVERAGKAAMGAAMGAMPAPPALAEAGAWPIVPDVADAVLPSVMRGMGRSDLPGRSELARLPHPTLILGWVGDPVHPVETAEQLAELLPGGRAVIAASPADRATWRARIAEFLS